MDEFLKINWRIKHISQLEPIDSFITEDVVAQSLVYKFFDDKLLFRRKKMKNLFQQGAYIPGHVNINTSVKSCLDKSGHEFCLKALKVFQSGKDPSSYTTSEQYYVEVFNKVKSRVLKEQSEYQNYVSQQWQSKDMKQLKNIKQRIIAFGRIIWDSKRKKISSYPQFFKELSLINTTFDENENIIDFVCMANVLDVGTLARFSHPNLKSPCILNNVTMPLLDDVKCVYSNLPVSQDENVTKILETHHNIDLVISASGLKCITDTSDPKRRWMIPLVIRNVNVQTEDGNTISKNVVFVDKPFSQNDVSHMDLAYISFKWLIKTNFCQFEAFKYNNDTPIQADENKKSCSNENSECDRPRNSRSTKVIHKNASYRIWNIKKTYGHNNLLKGIHKPVEFNVLIRSKLDACEGNEHGALQPVILKPKLEMQLRFGANVPSKAELAREWTSLFFTPFSNLYRVRIAPVKGEVICIEKCNIQKIVAEAQAHYHYKPQLGLGTLQKIFEELIHLEPGNYLLQHLPKHEAFLAVMKECEDGKQGEVFDFHAEYDKVSLSEFPKNWLPIDANVILPSFEAENRMPAMFTPKSLDWRKVNKSKSSQLRRRKQKQQNKNIQ